MNVTLEDRFIKLLKKVLGMEDDSNLGMNANLQLLGFNSISFINLVVLSEEEFGIEFADEELDISRFENLHSVLTCIEEKIAKTSSASLLN
ncbi:hypothetical protein GC096_11960 [Paenibacillus sp. LMG 31461]|uniref:Carrier domain-containing protein n=1 Tax=Paenibacillus plantarum TaxID=2654975 RepID=A0ABX1X9J5_9BACL|nr:acyl carrier protein [Paenibacillus plantarum]NOU64741.1 hypothetical protein [Paenibacillus plantarum]